MKYIILVGDGMAGYPIDELGGRTCLEAAATPEMDGLAAAGELYTLETVPKGMPPGSDVANLSLAGYRPEECYTGRAPLEAASMRVSLGPAETAFRCNLVTVERGPGGATRMIDYSAGHIGTGEAAELIAALAAALNSDAVTLRPGVSYRHLLVTTLCHDGLETVPPHDHIGQDVSRFRARYDLTPLGALIRRAEEVLRHHPVNRRRRQKGLAPANSIWLWGEGKAPKMRRLRDMYGVSGALISAVDLLKGIGVYAGMEVIDVPGATGYLDTNYHGKAEAAVAALARHDLVFVHVEAPDEAGHQGLRREKIRAIEDFDRKYDRDDLARGHVMFAATGVTDGTMLRGVRFRPQGAVTYSMVMRSKSRTLRYVEGHHHFDFKPRYR